MGKNDIDWKYVYEVRGYFCVECHMPVHKNEFNEEKNEPLLCVCCAKNPDPMVLEFYFNK